MQHFGLCPAIGMRTRFIGSQRTRDACCALRGPSAKRTAFHERTSQVRTCAINLTKQSLFAFNNNSDNNISRSFHIRLENPFCESANVHSYKENTKRALNFSHVCVLHFFAINKYRETLRELY